MANPEWEKILDQMASETVRKFGLAGDSRPADYPRMSAVAESELEERREVSRRRTLPEFLASKLPTGASRDLARMATHGLARTGNTFLRALDVPNRLFGNRRSLLQDIYETRRDVRAAEEGGDAPEPPGNFLATDRVPESIFGFRIVGPKGYTKADLAFFKEHPEAGGYYDMEGAATDEER